MSKEILYANWLLDGLPLFGMEWQSIDSDISAADRNRGAVVRGQEGNQVDSRVARRNYGIVYNSRCTESSSGAFWCPYEETWFQEDCMSWYITKVCTDTLATFWRGNIISMWENLFLTWCPRYRECLWTQMNQYRLISIVQSHRLVSTPNLCFGQLWKWITAPKLLAT